MMMGVCFLRPLPCPQSGGVSGGGGKSAENTAFVCEESSRVIQYLDEVAACDYARGGRCLAL